MPIYTNKYNLPAPFVKAVIDAGERDSSSWQISASELSMPPYMRMMLKEHDKTITKDVSDGLKAFMGTVAHNVLERCAPPDCLPEERLYADIKIDDRTVKLSGQADLLHNNTICDYKTCTVGAVKSPKPEWVMQLNTYRWLFEQHGHEIKGMQVMAYMMDWSKVRAMANPSYPQAGVTVLEIAKYDDIENWIKERIRLHEAADKGDFMPCTAGERWNNGDKWAVVRNGGSRAVKGGIFYNEPDADNFCSGLNPGLSNSHIVQHRPGRELRCELFCDVGANGLCEYKGK